MACPAITSKSGPGPRTSACSSFAASRTSLTVSPSATSWRSHSVPGSTPLRPRAANRTIRLNFTDRQHARALHDLLAVQLGCLVEFFSLRYGAIDLDNGADADSAVALLTRLHDAGDLGWEWADPALEGSIQGRPRPSPRGRPPVAGTLEERSSTYCGNPHFRNPICVRTCAPGAARHPGIGETRGPAATSRTDPAGVRALTGDCPRHRRQASYGS